MMRELLAVGAGGSVGAILRYVLSGWIQRALGQSGFPIGTLTVNLVGCLVIGLLGGLTEHREFFSPEAKLLVILGILGSFTTFSTFGYETLGLLRDGQFIAAAMSALLHLIVGLAAVWGGYMLSTLP
jgi:CrcB protein